MKNVDSLSDNEILDWFEKLPLNLKLKFWRSMASKTSYQDFIKDKYKIIDYYNMLVSYEHTHKVLRKKLGA
jgi:hypothetical protein